MPLGIATAQAKAGQIFAGLTFRLVLLGIIVALVVNTYADIELKGPLGIGIHFEGWKPKAQRHEAETKACEARHAKTIESVNTLQGVIEANNEAARKRAEAYENSLRVARERANENERRATASNARIARLEALAEQDGQCAIPEGLLAEIEGL